MAHAGLGAIRIVGRGVDVEEALLRPHAEAAAGAADDVLLAGAEGGVDVGGGEARVFVDGVPCHVVVLAALTNDVEILVDFEAVARCIAFAAAAAARECGRGGSSMGIDDGKVLKPARERLCV